MFEALFKPEKYVFYLVAMTSGWELASEHGSQIYIDFDFGGCLTVKTTTPMTPRYLCLIFAFLLCDINCYLMESH